MNSSLSKTGRRRTASLAPGWRRSFRLLLLVAGLSLGTLPCARGDAPALSEYEVKALFLFNFAKYIDWPEEAFLEKSSPIVINVLGRDNFKDHLKQAVAGKHINGRDIVIRHPVTIREAGDCHILFVSSSEKSQAEELLSGLRRRPVVTVGEQEQFLQKGGIINFIMKGGKVRLEISLDAARAIHVRLSSKLLGVADNVVGKAN